MLQENSLENLIKSFSKLPSMGQRSAKRIVLHLLNNKEQAMLPLAEAIQKTAKNIQNCKICGNLDSSEVCGICQNDNRDKNLICVVEEVADLWALEKSGVFNGTYHILGGVLSAINGKGPQDLNIANLVFRLKQKQTEQNQKDLLKTEVILATNSTLEGQTTAFYLLELLKEFNVKISKLTAGIPIGSELDYLDNSTLAIAFKTRSNF